jgi:hypothetical protein
MDVALDESVAKVARVTIGGHPEMCPPSGELPGGGTIFFPLLRGDMTDVMPSDAKKLMTLALRMGIPVDEAMRQVTHLIVEGDRLAGDPRIGEGSVHGAVSLVAL